jgi:hypothetical protein
LAILRRFVGQSWTYTVGTCSPSALSYQWRFNGTNIAGATSASLTLNNLQTNDSGNYTVVLSNSAGSITSAPAVLTIIGEPIILTQPTDLRVLQGSNVSFTVTATNAVSVTYFWQRNGVTFYSSTNNTYNLGGVVAAHQGAYSVIVSNAAGAVPSDPWTLTVILQGQAVGWGDDTFGQTNAPYPASEFVAIAAGAHHSLAVKEDGTVVSWGGNMHGETNPPAGLNDVVAVGAGYCHSLALRGNGTVVAWGDNTYGQTNVPGGLSGVKAIAAGPYHNLALKSNGVIVAWGDNSSGQTNVPAGLTSAIAIAAGYLHSLAVRPDGTVCAWGNEFNGQCAVPAGLTNVVAVAGGSYHSLGLKSDGTVVGWGSGIYGEASAPSGLSNVLAIAAGDQYSMALKNDGTVVVWGRPDFGLTNVPSPIGDVKAIAAGFSHALALTYSPVLNYPVNVSQDLLLIYNTNSTDSITVKDYYLAHRPMVGEANVLGIDCQANEYFTDGILVTNQLINPVLNWLDQHPTKHPQFILLMYGIPANSGTAASPGVTLNQLCPHRRPFVNHLNMRTLADCTNYVNKLAYFGTNYSPGRVYISARAGGYGNTNYMFDDIRTTNFSATVVNGRQGVVANGASSNEVRYVDNPASNGHLLQGTNIAGYASWGAHGGLVPGSFTNGTLTFSGQSGWCIIQTIESFNGTWDGGGGGQNTFHDWFTERTLGGTNYSSSAVGAVSHTNEPGGGWNDSYFYFGLWQAGKSFAICAWQSRRTTFFQATGDPFVRQ